MNEQTKENSLFYSQKKQKKCVKTNSKAKNPEMNEKVTKDAKLVEILRLLSETESFSDKLKDKLKKDITFIYSEDYRHSYYTISVELYNLDDEKLDRICTGISFLKILVSNNEAAIKGLNKLSDHVNLEVVRIRENNSRKNELNLIVSDDVKRISDMELSITKKMDGFKKELDDSMRSVSNILTQIVGILGIFAAIVIVFFGGASVFANVFANLQNINWIEVIPLISAVGFVMFNLIFMLLFILSRMTERDIGVRIAENSKISNLWLLRIVYRYPYIFVVNVILIIMFLVAA